MTMFFPPLPKMGTFIGCFVSDLERRLNRLLDTVILIRVITFLQHLSPGATSWRWPPESFRESLVGIRLMSVVVVFSVTMECYFRLLGSTFRHSRSRFFASVRNSASADQPCCWAMAVS